MLLIFAITIGCVSANSTSCLLNASTSTPSLTVSRSNSLTQLVTTLISPTPTSSSLTQPTPPSNMGTLGLDKGEKFIILASSTGALLLLLLTLFCVTFVLLCIVMKRLRTLSRWLQQSGVAGEKTCDSGSAAADKKQSHSGEPPPETELSNTENADPNAKGDNPNVVDLYATVPEEHRQMKKMAKLCIQQYDDINLLPLESREAGEGEDDSKMITSVTIEGGGGEGYSRLCHAGPRMNQPRYFHSSFSASSPQLLLDDNSNRNNSISSSGQVEKTNYSEVEPMRPRSRLIVPSDISGGYSLIEQGESGSDPPPPLPDRSNKSSHSPPKESGLLKSTRSMSELEDGMGSGAPPPIPYQNFPAVTDTAGEPLRIGAGYSMVANPASPPKITDPDFFGEVMEFHNSQAQEMTPDKLYEKVK